MRILKVAAGAVLCMVLGCGTRKEVVVYTALDRGFSEPVLQLFEKETGIKVLARYDTESTKTVGLVNAIRAEKDRPRCDVFWNNEIVNTIRLKKEGLLEAYKPAAAATYPAAFRDPDGYWHGFAARARVLICNTNITGKGLLPEGISDLADPVWKKRVGIAKPLFGTTATHVACLFSAMGPEKAAEFLVSLKGNEIQILGGNKRIAEAVGQGKLVFGLTDTDDAVVEIDSGKPVTIVYPDSGEAGIGTLFIPNTLSLVKGAPNADAGRRLIEFLLSPKVEAMLAACPSAQIPLNSATKVKARVKTPAETKAMAVDFNAAADLFEKASAYVEANFLK